MDHRLDIDARHLTATVRDLGAADLPRLMASSDPADRVTAEVLRRRLVVTLPDQFPCLYEVADSPSHEGYLHKRPHAWVTSPDVDMLHALLPDYQRLWDSYTGQWGPRARRVFAVGPLDGLRPAGMWLPGTTPGEVIAHTINLHAMYGAPADLKAMGKRNNESEGI